MITCSCFKYMYKEIRKGDPCYTGWGCPWIWSLLEHPIYYDPGNGVFCPYCGDRMYSNGSIRVAERDEEERLYIAQLRDKNMTINQRYKEYKFKGLSGKDV